MATLEITIDDLGAQGDGIAHENGATIFVSGALKGEKVRIELSDSTNAVKRGELVEVLVPVRERMKPPCPHYPQCGGCRLQHMNDSAYEAFKRSELVYLFEREGLAAPHLMPTVTTATQTRRRARVAAHYGEAGLILGFNAWRSHEIVDLRSCEVMKPEITDLIDKLRAYLPHWLGQGESCDIQITALPSGMDVTLIGGPKLDVNARQNLAELAERLDVAHLSWRKWDRSPVEPVSHRAPLAVQFGETVLAFPPASFLQATDAGAEALVDFVLAAPLGEGKVLDLFCGLGLFGLSLTQAKKVHFCDLDGPAIKALAKAIQKHKTMETSLRNLMTNPFTAEECSTYDLVIFDPPRGGAKAQAEKLAKSSVPSVVAISCDPPSFVRDAKILVEGGYRLENIQPVDQFLWSTHMELAALFVK
ncbi:MAG: methyltransferase [Alphaproteobacteria bacterium]|nr:methyltransferase [Alphaproteobacteria bacterium]